MIYETNYIMHYNKNHDKLGRFARSSHNLNTESAMDRYVEKTQGSKAFKKAIVGTVAGGALGGTVGFLAGGPGTVPIGAWIGSILGASINNIVTGVKMGLDDEYVTMYKEGKKFTDDFLQDVSDEVRRNDKR